MTAPLFLSLRDFDAYLRDRNAARQLGLPHLGRPMPSVWRIDGRDKHGGWEMRGVRHVNFDIRHLSKNGRWGVRIFFALPCGRIYYCREHDTYSKDRCFYAHTTPQGETREVTESWVERVLSVEC